MSDSLWNVFDIDGRAVVDLDQLGVTYRVARAIQVAHKLGVFERLLSGAADAATLAADLQLQPDPTERLLVLLAATGLLYHRPDGRFRLTAEGRAAFDPASPRFWGDGQGHSSALWTRWANLEDTLRHPPVQGTGAPDMPPDVHRTFVMAMHDYAIRGRCQWLAANVDLTGRRHLLDLGGGPGTLSIALCQRFEGLRATIFDLPATGLLLTANAARFGLADRIDFIGGDFDRDDLGGGYDCALLSNILHGPHHGSAQRLKRLHGILEAGAVLIVQDFIMDDDKNGPLEAALFNLHVGAYSIGEMCEVIEEAGFRGAALRGRGPAGNGLVVAVA
jgi:SAM-dependent methyltransferase